MNHYEKNLEELRNISQQFSEGSLSLAESVKLFEKGVRLAEEAVTELRQTQGKINELKREMDRVLEVPFEGDR